MTERGLERKRKSAVADWISAVTERGGSRNWCKTARQRGGRGMI